MRKHLMTATLVAAVVAGLCADAAAQGPPAGADGRGGGAGRGGRGGGLIPPLLMKTDAFEDGGIIPERYAGRGGNVRPAFMFSNIPAGTVSFAIVLQELDVAANGPVASSTGLPGTSQSKRAGSLREAFLKARLLELREWAVAITLARGRQQVLGTITTSSSSTR
jgi:hypothetical protein